MEGCKAVLHIPHPRWCLCSRPKSTRAVQRHCPQRQQGLNFNEFNRERNIYNGLENSLQNRAIHARLRLIPFINCCFVFNEKIKQLQPMKTSLHGARCSIHSKNWNVKWGVIISFVFIFYILNHSIHSLYVKDIGSNDLVFNEELHLH